ncbi:universal stress protein [Natronogracilivirga saccharolytica]|uniref:Universal stress protein n=1 Tax=Natronogracilivirga saccharolytica TaxID=2812953 RepID=A0A8J7RL02_9BACT|nr:universal stress protein [Natronogracilivirga saccharolytica]MBP3193630.1 universal stress protein [Natronogracilivirga saccharolytica]
MKNPRILVPTDFSDLSKLAFSNASAIAGLFDGKVTPFHAYMQVNELDGFYYMGETSPEADLRTLEKTLYKKLEQVASELVEEPYRDEPVVKIGNAARAITETGKDFDLIVMSSHGRTGFSRLILGSVCEKVLRTSHTPVLVLEKESRLMPLERILLTTDFSDNSIYAFEPAAEFAEATGARIDLVHIVSYEQFDTLAQAQHDSKERKDRLARLSEKYLGDLEQQVRTEVIFSEKSVHEEISRLTKSRPYNLVVMSTIGRTGLDYMMLGSTASSVLRHVKTAVLSFNPIPNQ